MIKLHTKYKSNLNYYLFAANEEKDVDSITRSFQTVFGIEPLFSSNCVIIKKTYVMIGSLELYEKHQFDPENFPFKLLQIFQSSKTNQDQNNPQLETFYLSNFIDKSIIDLFLYPLLMNLIKWSIDENTIKKIPTADNPLITYFQCTPDEIKHRIRILVPYFIKNEISDKFDFPIFTTKSSDIPVIIVKKIDQENEYQNNLHNFSKIKKYIEKHNYSRVINSCEHKSMIYFSVESNDEAWNIINRLTYSIFHKATLQFTHFLEFTRMENAKQWNLLVLNVDKDENYNSLFSRFSQINSEEEDTYESGKRILAIETYEESDTKNALVQFLNKSDAYEALKNDSKHIKIYNYSMLVINFDTEREEELHDIFPKASYILEKQNNSPRTRPIYQVLFDSKKDLSEALVISRNVDASSVADETEDEETNKNYIYSISSGTKGIYSNGLRVFCVAYTNNLNYRKIFNQLIRQTWKKNTVEIFNVHPTVQLSEVIQALTDFGGDCRLESVTFWNKKLIVAFNNKTYFSKATKNKKVEINGCEYTISPKNKT